MNRIVRRSTIIAVALATTLGAGAALADTAGISPEALKSALTSTRNADSTLASVAESSALGNRERFARYDLTNEDQSEFAALNAPVPTGGRVGILAPEHNGDIQFALPGNLAPQHNGDIQFAQAGVLTPQHNGDIQFARALADRQADAAFGDTANECESAPVKLADVGASLRQMSSEPSIAGDGADFAQRLQRSESREALANFKRFTADGVGLGSPSFAAISKALNLGETSNARFSALQVDEIAAIKSALNGSSDASSALSNGSSSSQLSSALRKR